MPIPMKTYLGIYLLVDLHVNPLTALGCGRYIQLKLTEDRVRSLANVVPSCGRAGARTVNETLNLYFIVTLKHLIKDNHDISLHEKQEKSNFPPQCYLLCLLSYQILTNRSLAAAVANRVPSEEKERKTVGAAVTHLQMHDQEGSSSSPPSHSRSNVTGPEPKRICEYTTPFILFLALAFTYQLLLILE